MITDRPAPPPPPANYSRGVWDGMPKKRQILHPPEAKGPSAQLPSTGGEVGELKKPIQALGTSAKGAGSRVAELREIHPHTGLQGREQREIHAKNKHPRAAGSGELRHPGRSIPLWGP